MTRPTPMLSLALAAGLALGLAGIAPVQAADAPAKKLQPISKAPDFTLKKSTDGKPFKLSDLKGKVRLVDFWATWCPPCREEIPGFIELQKKYQSKGLEILGVSVDRGGPAVVNAFSKEHGINYTSLMSEQSVESAFGGIRSIPSTFLIDREGNIVKKYLGARPIEEFEADIKSLL
jgi:cytochrome c biogenesis protein CcmG/thiol:disulfide interchange protein DsbE